MNQLITETLKTVGVMECEAGRVARAALAARASGDLEKSAKLARPFVSWLDRQLKTGVLPKRLTLSTHEDIQVSRLAAEMAVN